VSILGIAGSLGKSPMAMHWKYSTWKEFRLSMRTMSKRFPRGRGNSMLSFSQDLKRAREPLDWFFKPFLKEVIPCLCSPFPRKRMP
jgi:hypothetical protein